MDIAIVGRPNVGKSALFNRIAGRRIAIVHGQPGITRDRISAKCEIGGKTFSLWDTGGIVGAGETQLTGDVRASAELAMKESDLILFVVDGQEGVNPMDRGMPSMSSSNARANTTSLSIPPGFVRAANIPARLKSSR